MDIVSAIVLAVTAALATKNYFRIRELKNEQAVLFLSQQNLLTELDVLVDNIETLKVSCENVSLNTAAPQPKTENNSSVKPNVLSRSARRRIARRKQRQALKQSATLNNESAVYNQE
jgi:hypothetical protein